MGNHDNYQIKYWNDLENFKYNYSKPQRSLKRKLAIVFSFIFVLAVTPSLIYSLTNIDMNPKKEVSIVSTQNKPASEAPVKKEFEVHKVTIELPKETSGQTKVINNDSYWKISKRVCGDGKYYLSIQAQNNNKALKLGESVIASCAL